MNIKLKKRTVTDNIIEINLPASKSISNRLIMIQKQCSTQFDIQNLSTAGDTQILKNTLCSDSEEWDLHDAGTPLRFLTVYAAATEFSGIISGNDSLKRRPILPLIKALGIEDNIEWLGEKGFVPFKIKKKSNKIDFKLNAEKSSQYISALLLCTPVLGGSITIEIKNNIIPSKPYLDMTIALMKQFGAEVIIKKNIITAKVNQYKTYQKYYNCEADWTAASYFYTLCAANGQQYLFKGLMQNSLQGDYVLSEWFSKLGVKSLFTENGLIIKQVPNNKEEKEYFSFINNPDLAPAVIVCCAITNKNAHFIGTDTLKHKESDRLYSLTTALKKCGIDLINENNYYILKGKIKKPTTIIKTYNDHRIAMAMACVSSIFEVIIENSRVVNKSFPFYWKEILKK